MRLAPHAPTAGTAARTRTHSAHDARVRARSQVEPKIPPIFWRMPLSQTLFNVLVPAEDAQQVRARRWGSSSSSRRWLAAAATTTA